MALLIHALAALQALSGEAGVVIREVTYKPADAPQGFEACRFSAELRPIRP